MKEEEESGGGERGPQGHGTVITTAVTTTPTSTSTATSTIIAAASRGRACSPREPNAAALASSGWSRVRRRFPRSATASGAALQHHQHHQQHHQQGHFLQQQPQQQHAAPHCRPRAARLEAREREWLRADRGRGCVRLHGPDGASCGRALLCTEATEARELLRMHEQQQAQAKHKLDQRLQVKPQQQQQQHMKQELQQQQQLLKQNQVQQMLKRQTQQRRQQQHESVSPVRGRRSDEDNDEGEEQEEGEEEEEEEVEDEEGQEEEAAATRRQRPALYVRLVGHEVVRRVGPGERPLRLQRDFLEALGYAEPWRLQEEGAAAELASLFRLHLGKPEVLEHEARVALSGMFSVRKGRTQLHKWSERRVVLCGTCLLVSSLRESLQGKLHVIPLIGGKVEEVRKRQHCLAFSSAGPQTQTYYVSFNSFAEYLRWLRQASKIVSQRIGSVDLSCCNLEELPEPLFHSQDVTHLNLRHNLLGHGIGDTLRFSQLRSLNLSHNSLGVFPEMLCHIPTLTELNLSCNGLPNLPAAIGNMNSLQSLVLDCNALSTLPEELTNLQSLAYLGLSFNFFERMPPICQGLLALERVCLAGNRMDIFEMGSLSDLRHVKLVDLRLNTLRRLVAGDPAVLGHVTHLDVRDCELRGELDATSLACLETLRCDRNELTALRAAGHALKTLGAAHNLLSTVSIHPAPVQLAYADISRNKLESVPEWIPDATSLEILNISHNEISELPIRLLCAEGLKRLLAGHNQLRRLPERLERVHMETLDVQHNLLTELPTALFLKAPSLRSLNASANRLESLPPSVLGEGESVSTLQELYLANNQLVDKCVPHLTGHQHLRVLHLTYNLLTTFPASKLAKLTELEELNLSGNRLRTVPTTILGCKRLHTLCAHSNAINVFPEVFQLPEIKLVDLSCNELTEVPLPESLPPKLQELDLMGNPRLALDLAALDMLSHITCLKIDPRPTLPPGDAAESPIWSHGCAETLGQRKKLCVSSLASGAFGEDAREALYGVFDGERNVEVPRLLQCTMGDVLSEEMQRAPASSSEDHMLYTFLGTHKKLGTAGQKLGASAVLCHLRRDLPEAGNGGGGRLTLTAGNVGSCRVLLCRAGCTVSLTPDFTLTECREERERLRGINAIITEDNKVGGVTSVTRLLGCSFLYPSVLPRPHTRALRLTPDDELLLLCSRSLAAFLPPIEAVEAIRDVADPLAAAKKLTTLAQGYGCHDNLGVVVVRLSVALEDAGCCTCDAVSAETAVNNGSGGSSSGAFSELSSEVSSEVAGSEVSSEVGSTASDEQPPSLGLVEVGGSVPSLQLSERRCSLHPSASARTFQRQMSAATFSSAYSDPGLDSSDDEDTGCGSGGGSGVGATNGHGANGANGGGGSDANPLYCLQMGGGGQRLEVEADVHPLCALAGPSSRSLKTLSVTSSETSDEGIVISLRADTSVACSEKPPGAHEPRSSSAAAAASEKRDGEAGESEGCDRSRESKLEPSWCDRGSGGRKVMNGSNARWLAVAEGHSKANGGSGGSRSGDATLGMGRCSKKILRRIQSHSDLLSGRDVPLVAGLGRGGLVASSSSAGAAGAAATRSGCISAPHCNGGASTLGRGRRNGSVVTPDCGQGLMEVIVASDAAPARPKRSAYFVSEPAPGPDPDDELIVPPELEEEVREQIRQYQQQQKLQDQQKATEQQKVEQQQMKQPLKLQQERREALIQQDVYDTAL
ncbi:PH domain leucine-rich repeat-containing protein phosphatase 2-like isoform X1 [Lampetra fluviatilis]